MALKSRIGYGTTFFRGQTKIGGITDISAPALTRAEIDVTDMESPDGFMAYIPGLADGGEVSIEFNLYPNPASDTNQHVLREDLESGPNGAPTAFTIKFVTGPEMEFNGFVTAFSPALPLEDKMTGSVTVKVSGKPTWTTPSASGSGA